MSATMAIAREGIFGPVMSVIAYDTVEEAVAIAKRHPLRPRRLRDRR
jgi:acyl-CoA reductase-like NAD-dependent aldehyde dehydrogenase